jgi:hypothetical protein
MACAILAASPFASQPLVASIIPQGAGASSLPPPPAVAVLAAGTPVDVEIDENLTSATNATGDRFRIIVIHDVIDNGTIVIPKGAPGHGAITWLGGRGDFGKAGLIAFAVRDVEVGDRKIALDGSFREEGKNKNGATAATWVAVGVFAGLIKGKDLIIPKGRELRAWTRLPVTYARGASPPPVPTDNRASIQAIPAGAAAVIASTNPANLPQAKSAPAGAGETEGNVK